MRNLKLSLLIAIAGVAPLAFAQMGPPPVGMGQGRPPMQGSGAPRTTQTNRQTAIPAEAIRLLTLTAVQKDLAITAIQWTSLSTLVRSAASSTLTEDQALSLLSKVLSEAQLARLKELLVQDLGYGSLALSDVRARLSLTAEQAQSIASLLSTYETTKAALATSGNPMAAQKALADLRTTTNAALAKLLTSEQDAKLRALAGKALA